MTVRRLIGLSLLSGVLLVSGSLLALAEPPVRSMLPRHLEPGLWWWTGAWGEVDYGVIAPVRSHRHTPLPWPPGVQPIDPGDQEPGDRPLEATHGASVKSTGNVVTGGLSAASIGSGLLSVGGHAPSAPARPDARDVRRELESARRLLGL